MLITQSRNESGAMLRALLAIAGFILLVRLTLHVGLEIVGIDPGLPSGYSREATLLGIAFDGLIVLLGLALYRWLDRRDIKEFGFSVSPLAVRVTLLCLLLLATIYLMLAAVTTWQGISWARPEVVPLYLLRTILVGLAVGFGEEVFFRGYIHRTLMGYGRPWSYLISCSLFALAHFAAEPFHVLRFIGTFLPALLFTYLYEQTGSIWPGTVVHAALNLSGYLLIRDIPYISLLTYGEPQALVLGWWQALYFVALVAMYWATRSLTEVREPKPHSPRTRTP